MHAFKRLSCIQNGGCLHSKWRPSRIQDDSMFNNNFLKTFDALKPRLYSKCLVFKMAAVAFKMAAYEEESIACVPGGVLVFKMAAVLYLRWRARRNVLAKRGVVDGGHLASQRRDGGCFGAPSDSLIG